MGEGSMYLKVIIILCNGNSLNNDAEYSEEGDWVISGSQSDAVTSASLWPHLLPWECSVYKEKCRDLQ